MSAGILVLNAGSSSLKFSLYTVTEEPLSLRLRGQLENIGGTARFAAADGKRQRFPELPATTAVHDHGSALKYLLDWLGSRTGDEKLRAVGHRVVHGGQKFSQPVQVDSQILAKLETVVPLAPLHQPYNLAAIRELILRHPELPQVACFDTAFHRSQPEVAQRFALPYSLHEDGIRRYGFHGLSYEYIAQALPELAGTTSRERVIIAHLGNGASLCAIRDGHSIATSMGFTALDGLPMGSRCGALDPGVVLYLIEEQGMTVAEVSDLLYHRSGLLGVSGISNDMRTLLVSENPRADEAIELYVYRIQRELGSLAAALGGLDGIVFTGGIGEHAVPIRAQVCRAAEWLGVRLNSAANQHHGPLISTVDSRVAVWVIPTDEEWMIARHTLNVLSGTANTNSQE